MKNFMNFVGIMLGAVMLCDKATDENYNFEAGMKKQEEKINNIIQIQIDIVEERNDIYDILN